MIDSKPTFTSFAKQADILSRLHRELGFSEGDGGGEVLPLDELRKRNEADPASIVKADVRNSIAAEAEARWRSRGSPADPILQSKILSEVLAEPVKGWFYYRLNPAEPPRPTWSDLLDRTFEDQGIAKSAAAAASQEAQALDGMRRVADEIRSRDPRITPQRAMADARLDPIGKKFYAVYVSAQRARRRLESQ